MSRRWMAGFAIYTGLCSAASLVSYSEGRFWWSAFFLFWAVVVGILLMKVEIDD